MTLYLKCNIKDDYLLTIIEVNMARPYILIQEDILLEIEDLYYKGVPIRKLVRQFKLSIASPTLQRLVTYLTLANRSLVNGKESLATKKVIYASLFPIWLGYSDKDEVIQPSNYIYEGAMPLGKWVKKNKGINE